MTKRTFVAIDIKPDENLMHAARVVQEHFRSENIKWVRLDRIHITLAFLGDTSEGQVLQVKELLKERLQSFGLIGIEVQGVGFFGKRSDPKVLWFGLEVNRELTELHGIVNSIVGEAGLTVDEKPFRPHITLGRVRSYSGATSIDNLPESIRKGRLMTTSVGEVVFYESILKPEGPVYIPIEKIETT